MLIKFLLIFIVLICLAFLGFIVWASRSNKLDNFKAYEIISNKSIKKTNLSKFSVLSYNMGYASSMKNNKPIEIEKSEILNNLNEIKNLLEKYQPSIIGLQEIDFASDRTFYIDQAKLFADSLIDYSQLYLFKTITWNNKYVPYPYWPPNRHFGKILSGQAIMSNLEIKNCNFHLFKKPNNNNYFYNLFYLNRLAQFCTVTIENVDVIISNVHLEAYDEESRIEQAKFLRDYFSSIKFGNKPFILIGDFNSIPQNSTKTKEFLDEPETDFSQDNTIQIIKEIPGISEVFVSNENANFTFPSDKPNRKLDYIFYSNHFRLISSSVIKDIKASDHLPIIGFFEVKILD